MAEASAIAAEERDGSGEAATVPGEAATVPGEGATVPGEGATVPGADAPTRPDVLHPTDPRDRA